MGSALLLSCPQGQTSCDTEVRGRPILQCTQTSTCHQVTVQPRGDHLAFGGNRPLLLWGHGPKHGLQWQHRPRPHYSLRWPHWFLTTLVTPVLPLFIVPTPFCFFFSSISPTLTTAPLCCAQGPMSVWDHFRRAMPHTCIMAPSSSQLGHAPCSLACTALDW